MLFYVVDGVVARRVDLDMPNAEVAETVHDSASNDKSHHYQLLNTQESTIARHLLKIVN
jgi:hypothetical protein